MIAFHTPSGAIAIHDRFDVASSKSRTPEMPLPGKIQRVVNRLLGIPLGAVMGKNYLRLKIPVLQSGNGIY